MIRRDFLVKSGLMGSALFLPALTSSCKQDSATEPGQFYTPIRRKAKLVMLSTQKQNWEHGIASQTFVETGDETMMIHMAKEAVNRQGRDGRLAVISQAAGIFDSATSLIAVLRSAEILNDPELKRGADRMITYLLETAPRTEDGFIYHSYHGPELWADSMYYGTPFMAYAGLHDLAVKHAKEIIKRLWNEEAGLFGYRWNAERQQIVNPRFWGLANAHAISGMAKLIEHLPNSMDKERNEFKGHVKKHLDGCLRYKREDYLFHNNINEPGTFVETGLAARLAWTIFTGIKDGWLESDYLETAMNMRKAVYDQIDDLGNVMGVPGSPGYASPGRSVEGQAFFLMMEAAFDKLNA